MIKSFLFPELHFFSSFFETIFSCQREWDSAYLANRFFHPRVTLAALWICTANTRKCLFIRIISTLDFDHSHFSFPLPVMGQQRGNRAQSRVCFFLLRPKMN